MCYIFWIFWTMFTNLDGIVQRESAFYLVIYLFIFGKV